MATQAQLQAWLTEAEQARHELILGNKAASVSSSSGKSVTFTASDLAKLDTYIASLRAQLGQATGLSGPFFPVF
ncbi:MAG: hypothetical protein IKE60_02360 [Reyranella sp.]|uniref:gpW family head-tail joining protein n=1 Tax=Reyranella sp. TaxID=1929291 RepID=UPI0025E83200|nr:gpW family head-tail joining protein [Reyranella sp.]MBR2813465.1 hypothetical protein [Reyranella sp.]